MDKKKQIEAADLWKSLEIGRNYKSQHNLYDITRQNEDFYIGEHHKGVNSKNLKNTVFNFLAQQADVKVSSVAANKVSLQRSAEAIDEDDETTMNVVNVLNELDRQNWERLNMDAETEQVLLDSALSGLGVSFFYWDEDIITGNTFKNKGDFKHEIIDSINMYVSNPNEVDIQKQDWIIISIRKTVEQLRKMAKENNVPADQIEMITGDETTVYEGYSKADNEQTGRSESNLATLNIKLWKDDDIVYFAKATKSVVITQTESTELTRYPIAILPWKPRKRFIYGEAELTRILENQKAANLLEAMRTFNAVLMGVPKFAYFKDIVGGMNNAIGGMHPINGDPSQFSINNIMGYIQPSAMTIDVDKSISELIDRTQALSGVNQNLLGAARAENAAALLTQIKQASLPIETYRRRYYKYLEDIALIWQDFYSNKYELNRRIKTKDGQIIEFNKDDFKDISVRTKVDVGPSNQYSEITQLQTLNDMWTMGIIKDAKAYLKRLPKGAVSQVDELIEEMDANTSIAQTVDGLLQSMGMQVDPNAPLEQKVQMLAQAIQQPPMQETAQLPM